MDAKTLTFQGRKLKVVFLTVVGSVLHKLDFEGSDTDYKGVFVWDKEFHADLNENYDVLNNKTWKKVGVTKEDWQDFLDQFNKAFNLEVQFGDDLDLFEDKKFFLSSLKNDFNYLDMLWSNKVTFLAKQFQNVLDNREHFLDFDNAKSRFFGMASGSLKEGSKENREQRKRNKDLAKSLQFLYSLDELLTYKTYSTYLRNEDNRNEVLSVKKGERDLEFVNNKFKELETNLLDRLETNPSLLNEKSYNKEVLNKVLVDLVLSTH